LIITPTVEVSISDKLTDSFANGPAGSAQRGDSPGDHLRVMVQASVQPHHVIEQYFELRYGTGGVSGSCAPVAETPSSSQGELVLWTEDPQKIA